jgi:probable rRNA maturation factor
MKPALHIDLLLNDPRWRAVDGVARLVRGAARAALKRQARGLRGAELGLVLADDARLRTLNRTWRGVDRPTNVLAFPADGPDTGGGTVGGATGKPGAPPRQLGDVVLAYETVAAEARAQRKPIAAHLSHLVVHGVLHLLGFDHETAAEAADMEAAEVAILAGLGWPDPYRPPAARSPTRASGRTGGRRAARPLARVA